MMPWIIQSSRHSQALLSRCDTPTALTAPFEELKACQTANTVGKETGAKIQGFLDLGELKV